MNDLHIANFYQPDRFKLRRSLSTPPTIPVPVASPEPEPFQVNLRFSFSGNFQTTAEGLHVWSAQVDRGEVVYLSSRPLGLLSGSLPPTPRLLLTPLQKAHYEDDQEFRKLFARMRAFNKPVHYGGIYQALIENRLKRHSPTHTSAYEAHLSAFERTWGIRRLDRTGRYDIRHLENAQ